MHGETGSGKTHLALGLAGQAGVNLIYVQGPRLFSRWLGETERNVVCSFLPLFVMNNNLWIVHISKLERAVQTS